MLKENQNTYGFKLKKETKIEELSATLYELEYEKNGARLLYLDREDENKTFSIAFKTIPEDSTGVFHIIEHSVLCGSQKYPVKEPFVELLKGSLNTFLNAMTFCDKTMYPVSSRNDKDFYNLVSVYLDAVFCPAILKKPDIFLQEGWHYEVSEEGELSTAGVVLNEMRGAYSAVDDVELSYMQKLMYPDTCYRHDSGGAPEEITTLTYEEFVRLYKKYYHPSNSYIFLDGSVDLDSTLPLISSYLERYEYGVRDFDIPTQTPVKPEPLIREYEITEGKSEEDKTRLSLGFMGYRCDERFKAAALSVLLDVLTSSNSAPLKKRILDSGLCEDLEIFSCDSVKENIICIGLRNVKDGKWQELSDLFFDTVKDIAEKGIDKELIESSLNSYEFKTRECDFGTMPRGVIYAMTVLETYLYGIDAAESLRYEELFKKLRESMAGRYFEELLTSTFIDNPHRATLVLLPSSKLGKEREEAEQKKMQKLSAEFGKDGLENLKELDAGLKERQAEEDTEEALKTLPTLTRDDISDKVEKIPRSTDEYSGVEILTHNINCGGIVYTELYFDVSDFSVQDIYDFRIISSLFSNLPTKNRDVVSLQTLIKSELGSFDLRLQPLAKKKETKIYVVVSSSALFTKRGFIPSVISEILLSTKFDDKKMVRDVVRQLKLGLEDAFNSAGHQIAMGRATAYLLSDAAVSEYYTGYEAFEAIKELEENFDERFDMLRERLISLARRIFTRGRLTVSVTGCESAEFGKELSDAFPSGEKVAPVCSIKPLSVRKEGIVIPAQVGYAAAALNLYDLGERPVGSFAVVRNILSYSYLWNSVRVQGGAYGAGMVARNNGAVAFYSYRDPSPERTFGCYFGAGDFLREFAASGVDITKFIIGAVGEADTLMTPRLRGVLSATRYLRGVSYEDECATRRELVMTDEKELSRIADLIDRVESVGAFCVVGGRDKINASKDYINSVLEV